MRGTKKPASVRSTRHRSTGESRFHAQARVLAFIAAAFLCVLTRAQAHGYSVLYSFQCRWDGSQPYGGLLEDAAGNLYGTTGSGGRVGCSDGYGCGTVFKVTSTGRETVLYPFGALPDGHFPFSGSLARDSQGNLYGTTTYGGDFNRGAVFELEPNGSETVVFSFYGDHVDPTDPGGLIIDPSGNLYGTSAQGGRYDVGTVYELDPATGTETDLVDFRHGGLEGAYPYASLIMDPSGNLYGTTTEGGYQNQGVVFRVDPITRTETVLHLFAGPPNDGGYPIGSLIRDSLGTLYGTTADGGSGSCSGIGLYSGCGVVFSLDTKGSYSVLYNFKGSPDSASPTGGLAEDAASNLYGTTVAGGDASCNPGYGCGVLFKLDPTGTETILHTFTGQPDGAEPYAALLQDDSGNLYGTTISGGTDNCGTVFKYTP